METTKYVFSIHALCKQKRYSRRHIIEPRIMKLRSFISRPQELDAYLREYPPDTEGQETMPLQWIKSWTSSTIPHPPHGKQIDWTRFQLHRLYC